MMALIPLWIKTNPPSWFCLWKSQFLKPETSKLAFILISSAPLTWMPSRSCLPYSVFIPLTGFHSCLITSVSCPDKATASRSWLPVRSAYSISTGSSAPHWFSLSLKTLLTASFQLLKPAMYWPGTLALSRKLITEFSVYALLTWCLVSLCWTSFLSALKALCCPCPATTTPILLGCSGCFCPTGL